jgi:alanyl aminopeptidase
MQTRSLAVWIVLASCAKAPQAPDPATPAAPAPPRVAVPLVMPPPPKLRLPTTVVPKRQAVTLDLDPNREMFQGNTRIELELKEPTNVIWLHDSGLQVHRVQIQGAAVELLTPMQSDEFLALVADRTLEPGPVTVEIDFSGKLPARDGRGAYRQEERGDWYIFTQFEATDARRAFPCFDEPSFKIPWQLTLDVPQASLAFANTPSTGEKPLAGGIKRVRFAPTRPLPSYLVAFAVGPFEVVDAGKVGRKPTPVRIIVPKGKSDEAAYAVKTTGDVVKRMEDYFDIPYPYEKLDHIAVPQKGGAMENPGLITYGTGTILGKPGEKNIGLERGYLGIAAHELGHIWFGDLVTTSWWDDLWLNEAFATWISAKIVHEMHPEWQGDASRVQSRSGIMRNDALASARKIRQPIESKHDIANAFDGITYQKGAAVIGMWETFFGADRFRDGVRRYLKKHADGNATAQEFLTDVEGETNEPVLAAGFATFLDQTGYPLVKVSLECTKGQAPKVLLSQKRYRATGAASTPDQRWLVPVCVRHPGGKACKLLTDAPGELTLEDSKTCPAWLLPNAGGLGYYRVDYQGDLLKKLLADGGKALTIPERLSVLGDVQALVTNGTLPAGQALELVPALARDFNRHIVNATAGMIGGLSDHYVSDQQRANYRRFVQKTYGARARALGWKPRPGEEDDTRLVRGQLVWLVAYEGEDATLRAEARALAEKWLTDRKAIEPELVGNALQLAAKGGDRAFWDKLHGAAKAEKDRRDRNRLLDAMGAFEDPKIVEEGMKLALTDEFDPRESMALIFGPTGNRRTRQMAYDFVKANYDTIVGRLPKPWGAGMVRMASPFCDAEHRADAEAFFKSRTPSLEGGPRTYAQAMEGIDMCIARRTANEPSVRAFLAKQ